MKIIKKLMMVTALTASLVMTTMTVSAAPQKNQTQSEVQYVTKALKPNWQRSGNCLMRRNMQLCIQMLMFLPIVQPTGICRKHLETIWLPTMFIMQTMA
jgi:hypothetical protein